MATARLLSSVVCFLAGVIVGSLPGLWHWYSRFVNLRRWNRMLAKEDPAARAISDALDDILSQQ